MKYHLFTQVTRLFYKPETEENDFQKTGENGVMYQVTSENVYILNTYQHSLNFLRKVSDMNVECCIGAYAEINIFPKL